MWLSTAFRFRWTKFRGTASNYPYKLMGSAHPLRFFLVTLPCFYLIWGEYTPKMSQYYTFCSPIHLGIIDWGQSMWAQIQLARLILKHFNVKRQSNFNIGKSPIWWKKVIVFHAKGTLLLDYFLKINDYRERKNTIILHGIELLILVK